VLLPEGDLLRDVHLRGAPGVPTVALTFDDGPNGACTAAVLDALAATGAPATFFVLGANVDVPGNDALLARMVREGHGIGIHGADHMVRPLFGLDRTLDEIDRAREAIAAGLARAGMGAAPRVRFYRPPFGLVLEPTAAAAAAAGLVIVEWTISVGDWRVERTPADLIAAILARVRPGDVIVLHDGHDTRQLSRSACVDRPNAAAVVRGLVPALRARHLEPAPLATVLGLGD
jgi:chitooligosaccharide deacetylase